MNKYIKYQVKKKSALNYGAMNINVFTEIKYVSQIQQKFKSTI